MRMPDSTPAPAPQKLPPRKRAPDTLTQEDAFGNAFDGRVVNRFLGFLKPYRVPIYISIGAVLIFTATQIAIPLMIRHIVDDALTAGAQAERLLMIAVGAFFGVAAINYIANY
jgi:ATP-binding cassette subfamily B protein